MISNGKVVTLAYSLKNSKGELLDQSDAADPFLYLHGADQIVPGLEEALEGLNLGTKKSVTVSPELGYGDIDPELRFTVQRSQFPAEANMRIGMEFQANGPEGQGMIFVVEKIEGDQITINGNHPLAGETLHFDVEVLAIRDATEDELEHGHAHGPNGHHIH